MTALSRLLSLFAVLGLGAVAQSARADVLGPFQETPIISGLNNPTAVRFAPDGRIFVAEQGGLLKVYNGLGDQTPDIAVDLSGEVFANWDRGFLGLAIDPQFPAAGHDFVYVMYTVDAPPGQTPPVYNDQCADQTTNGCVTRGRLSRLEIGPNNQMIGTEQILVDDRWCFQYPSHSIGDLHFGPEGALYLTGGEGASFTFVDYGQVGNPCNDPPNEGGALRSQDVLTPGDPTTWDGALVRLDVSGPIALPWPTNPTAGGATSDDDAIVAHGFRNPYRFTIHPGPGPQAGEVWVGDVGQDTWEEINRIPNPNGSLLNFGWPCYEGGSGVSSPMPGFQGANLPLCNGLYNATIASNVTPSVFAYRHDQNVVAGEGCSVGGGSISGMAFYEGTSYPNAYLGALFFEDYTRRCLWAMLPDTPGGVPNPANIRPIIWNSDGAVDLETGPGGDLYYAEYLAGRIMRLQYFPADHPPVAALTATPSSGPGPLAVAFDASGSTDSDPGDTLTYTWDLDGDGQFNDTPDTDPRFAHRTYATPGPVTVSVKVTDNVGVSTVASVTVVVANSPPVATILTPPGTLTWKVGDTINFSGSADDPDEGLLPPSHLSWDVLLHHCTAQFMCHVHHLASYPGVDSGSFIAPDHSYPSYLELDLTARDSGVGWYDTAWSFRRSITFNNSADFEDLIGFPVLVKLDPTMIDYSKIQSAGQDLRFFDPDGTPLPYEIETWNPTGTSYVWVRVPKVDAGSASDSIVMYYDNPNAADAQNPAGVWDSTYSGVWHLGGTTDSTAYANNGVTHGATTVAGQFGNAASFNGSSWIEVADSPSLELASTATIEAWVQLANPSLDDYTRIIDKKNFWTDPAGYDLEYNPGEFFLSMLGSGPDSARSMGLTPDTAWHYVTGTISGTTGHLYMDGVDRTGNPVLDHLAAGTSVLDIGRSPGNSNYFRGQIDELRVSNVARSAAWIHAQYLSMSGQFTTLGPEQGSGGLTNTASVLLYPQTQDLTFQSQPSGLQITVGGVSQATPFTQTVITNSQNTIAAISPQTVGGVSQTFSSWSDGGTESHDIVATTSRTFTATFLGSTCGNGVVDPGEDCDGGTCCTAQCHFAASGSTCSDGNACTTGETCSAGVCGGGTSVTCNDNNGCTQDTCNPTSGCVYNPTPLNGTSCNDGNACTVGETCNAGTCGGGGPVVCNDGNACTADSCNPASGCIFNPAPLDGASCNDGNICTTSDVCDNGTCGGTPSPDGDGDGTCNAADNCPYVANPGQPDSGGVGSGVPDGIGNACQCGDVTGEGIVDAGDVASFRAELTSGVAFTGAAAQTCSVIGASSGECNILDVVVIRRALLGQAPGVAQVCTAALPH